MIYDTSYSDRPTTRKIDLAVGSPLSWKERFKLGGIGSKRMKISHISEEYSQYVNAEHYISNANIEIRPKGLIIHFRHKLQAYSWIMPFEDLTVKHDGYLRLESAGKFIQFDEPGNEKFIQKLMARL